MGLRGDDFDLREVQANKGALVEREVIEKSVVRRQLQRYNEED